MTPLLSARTSAPGGIVEVCQSIGFMADTLHGRGPAREIADAIQWLDPFWYDGLERCIDDELWSAMRVCRSTFPKAYVEAMSEISNRSDMMTIIVSIETKVGEALSALIPEEPDWWAWGWGIELWPALTSYFVPYACVGYDTFDYLGQYENREEMEDDSELGTILHWLNIPKPGEINITSEAADELRTSLLFQRGKVYDDLWHLVAWLFGQTGNSYADYTDSEFSEMGMTPPTWDELDFAIEVQKEALGIINKAMAGKFRLLQDEELALWFRYNVKRVINGATANQLHWPSRVGRGHADRTASHANRLSTRRHPAQKHRSRRNDRISGRPKRDRQGARSKSDVQHRFSYPEHAVCRPKRSQTQSDRIPSSAAYRLVARRFRRSAARAAAAARHGQDHDRRCITELRSLRRSRQARVWQGQAVRSPAAARQQWRVLGNGHPARF